jgi:hypothetical protein
MTKNPKQTWLNGERERERECGEAVVRTSGWCNAIFNKRAKQQIHALKVMNGNIDDKKRELWG